VSKQRNAERVARNNKARKVALLALQELHPGLYEGLLAQAQSAVNEEAGPLPGDDDYQES